MKKEPFQLTVNAEHEFQIDPDRAHSLDMVPNGPGKYHLLHNGKAFQVEVLDIDYAKRTYTLRLNGKKQVVQVADYYDRLVKALGLHSHGHQKLNILKAPMPGLVLEVAVQPGQTVEKGDTLLILEAMKMENVLKAAGDGTVKSVHVQKGQAVEKGLLLMEFEG